MKYLLLIFIFSLSFQITGCAPNRLSQSLESSPPNNLAAIAAPTPDGKSLQPQLATANIDLDKVDVLLPPDAIPAILPDEVPNILVTATEADAAGMQPDVRVLGVSLDGDSRAYPIPYMSAHEIVNDEVGGRSIAATW